MSMFEIKNNFIKITKGDSAKINVNLCNPDGSPYTMSSGDKLKMSVRKKIGSQTLIEVESTDNAIRLTPSITSNLIIGQCVYDIELQTAGGDVFTVVGLHDNSTYNMYVIAEVTE